MRFAPVALVSLALMAACRGSGDQVVGTVDDAMAIDGAPGAATAPHGSGKKIGIVFTANVLGELEPCG